MKTDSKRRWIGKGIQKVKHLAVLSFFFHALPALAASNTVTGTVYGDAAAVATAASIASIQDGTTDLRIQHAGTANLALGHAIKGSITITNGFSTFSILAANSSVAASGSSALDIKGGDTLKISGGSFSGSDNDSPMTPSAHAGATIYGTRQTTLDGTTIIGGSNFGIGAPALEISDGELIVTGDSVLTGGPGNSAILAITSDVQITNGTFTGGTGAAALTLLDGSTATIHGGTFHSEMNIPTFIMEDSDLFLNGGSVTNGGLYSRASANKTSTVEIHSGLFDSLVFKGAADSSLFFFTAGSNFTGNTELFQLGGNMAVTNLADDTFQTVRLSDGASIQFTRDFALSSGGTFWLDSNSEQAAFTSLNVAPNATLNVNAGRVYADYFTADSFSTNMLSITSTTNGLIDAQTAHFKTDSILAVNISGAGLSSIETNTYALLSANTNQLFAGASTNTAATAESFKQNVDIETPASDRTRFVDLYFDTVGGSTLVKFQFTAQSLNEYWGLSNGTSSVVTEEFANEMDELAGSEMLALIEGFGSSAQSLAATEETYFTTFNTFQIAMQGLQAAVGQSVSRGAEFREQLKLVPPGAKGPERKNDLRGWGKFYGQFYSHDADGLNREYDATLHGGVVGVDKSIGSLLLGISGGSGRYTTTIGDDGEENTTAYHGALYGTYGTDRAYFDAGIAYGFNEVETQTDGPFVLNGEFDSQILSAYFGGGYDLVDTKGGTVFTPEASIQYSFYEQDAYSETSTVGAVPRNIDAFDADSLRSSLGLNVSMLNTTKFETFGFKLDGRAHWLHEFNPDPGNMAFGLEGGNNDYELAYPLLDEELFRVGFGFSFFNTLRQKPKNVLLRLDFDELFGDGFNSHNLSAKVIYAF